MPTIAYTLPVVSPASRYCSAWEKGMARGPLLARVQYELAVLHGEHLERVEGQAIVVRRGEVEHPTCAREALDALDRVAHLVLVRGACLLQRLGDDEECVVDVAAEGAHVLLELRLVGALIGDQHLLLRVRRGQQLGVEEASAREDDALGRLPRCGGVAGVAEAVALDEQLLHAALR